MLQLSTNALRNILLILSVGFVLRWYLNKPSELHLQLRSSRKQKLLHKSVSVSKDDAGNFITIKEVSILQFKWHGKSK